MKKNRNASKAFMGLLSLGLCVSGLLGVPWCAAETEAEGFGRLLDAVVRLDVWEAEFSEGSRRVSHGVGSGVIMTAEGHLLTNAHVVGRYAEQVMVTLASLERVRARLVGWDHWTDLAVLQLDMEEVRRRGLRFSHAEFGDSAGLHVAQPVMAVGTPNGLTRTVTRGILSNTQRYFQGSHGARGYETGHFNTWLQTDAAINPGNSGGPLVTLDGRVVGINTLGYLGANNLGFAVPSSTAREVMAALMEKGEVRRSYVGLVPAPLQDLETFFALSVNEGMLVQAVDAGSPAAEAGLRAGDIVLALDDEPLDGRFPEQLPEILHRIAAREVGSVLVLRVKRGERVWAVSVTTELLESRVGEEFALEAWGLSVRQISRAVAREERLPSADGVRVLGVRAAFPAEEAGVRPGMVLVAVNRAPLRDMAALRAVYAEWEAQPDRVLLEALSNHRVSLHVLRPR